MNVFEPFQFWRRAAATRLALMYPGGAITYGQLGSSSDAAANAILKAGFRPKEMVNVSIVNPVFQIIIMIALSRLNVPFVFSPSASVANSLGLKAHGSILEGAAASQERGRVLRTDHNWFISKIEASAAVEFKPVEGGPDDVVRAVLTSGSTGERKAIELSHSNMEARIRAAASHPDSGRTLCMLPPTGSWGFLVMLKVLRSGGTFCFAPFPDDCLDLCETVQADVICASVGQAATLAEEQAKRTRGLTSVRHLFIGGSPSSEKLVTRLRQYVCRNISVGYGSTETGQAASGPLHLFEGTQGAAGFIHPNVRVEIIGENGQTLPLGDSGRIKIAGPGNAVRYSASEVDANSAFQDGWFLTNDIGRMTKGGVLVIEGREFETVLNRGGFKISATRLEDEIRGIADVSDLAVFSANSSDGSPEIWAAVVSAALLDTINLKKELDTKIGAIAPDRVFAVDFIPRNEIGKIQYELLRMKVGVKTQSGNPSKD